MSRRKITVLMLGGAKRVSLARLLKAAGQNMGQDVEIVSYETVAHVPISAEGRVVEGRRWRDQGTEEHICSVIDNEHIDIVLPFVDGAIEICSRLRSLRPQAFIPVSDYAVAHAMFDKATAAALFAEKGIAVPATYSASDCRFPAICKPREGSASKGIFTVSNAGELARVKHPGDYLIQEYIENREEYTVDCYVSALSGKVKCTVPRLRISTSGGEVDRTQTCRIPALMSESERILTEIGLVGPVTLQFLHDLTNGRFLLMEINPRLGGGVVCSIRAGADIASMILHEACGKEAECSNDWRDGALMTRYFDEVMFYTK